MTRVAGWVRGGVMASLAGIVSLAGALVGCRPAAKPGEMPETPHGRGSVRCQPGLSDEPDGENPSVRHMCEQLARAIREDDRAAWLEMTASFVAYRGGGFEGLESQLQSQSIRDLLGIPAGRKITVVVLEDCSLCRRSMVRFGFSRGSNWSITVETGTIIVLGRRPDEDPR